MRTLSRLLLLLTFTLSAMPALGDTLQSREFQITVSAANETTPTIGNDGTSDLVVYTMRVVLPDGSLAPGDIWYQRVAAGAPIGPAMQVTADLTDDELNDVSGDYIVYTAYDSVTSVAGTIMLYRLSTYQLVPLARADVAREPRIHGNNVVWVQGTSGATQIMWYELGWLGTAREARQVAGPTPPASEVAIGSHYIVWTQVSGGQNDVWAFDLVNAIRLQITLTPGIDESQPATSGEWITWQAQRQGATSISIEAMNPTTWDIRWVVLNDTYNFRPSIDGDLIAWESRITGNLDVFVHRLSTSETFQVTSDPADQYLNDVLGDKIAWVDLRNGSQDVYAADLTFVPADPCAELGGDSDGDGVCADGDNCPATANQDQTDSDADGVGDACEPLPAANAGPDQTVHVGSLVSLDGSGSSDPGGRPLTYAWSIQTAPPGDPPAQLSDASVPSPTFRALWSGSYVLQLTVTNTVGQQASDTITVSTTNSPPVVEAGDDQFVAISNSTVHLDGSQSYDPDGDILMFTWALLSRPAGSQAVIDFNSKDPAHPTFVADVHGTYVVQLVVSDNWASSAPDTVTVTFENVKPVAVAKAAGSVLVGDSVFLDGSASLDANNDPITYQWSLVSMPQSSSAAISDSTQSIASFVPDVPGTYVAQLIVSDGILSSDPSTVAVLAITTPSVTVSAARDLQEAIALLPTSAFTNRNHGKTLNNKLNAVIQAIQAGRYADALDQLENDIMKKVDGCATTQPPAPDKQDWINNCADQATVYPLLLDLIANVMALM